MILASSEAVVRVVAVIALLALLRVVATFRGKLRRERADLSALARAIDNRDREAAFAALYVLLKPAMLRAFGKAIRGQPIERLQRLRELFATNEAEGQTP